MSDKIRKACFELVRKASAISGLALLSAEYPSLHRSSDMKALIHAVAELNVAFSDLLTLPATENQGTISAGDDSVRSTASDDEIPF